MSTLTFSAGSQSFTITGQVFDVSIGVQFDQAQPNHFGAPRATATAMRSGDFIGDTRQGGSCNAFSVQINPHCNGTHTECVGHLTTDRISINDHCPTLPLLALVCSVETTTSRITRDLLEQHFKTKLSQNPISAVVIRTLPNSDVKCSKQYTSDQLIPYLEPDAAQMLVENNIEHILIDLPSLDPYNDSTLPAHRVFFGLPEYANSPTVTSEQASRPFATITEMIFVSDHIPDGLYLLNLQIPAFELDTAPSRPLLYTIET